MKKSYFYLAVLFWASALSATAAQSEADFTAARDQAVSRLTAWTESSPFAQEALATGIANLTNLAYGSYSNADAAVKDVNDVFEQTMTLAREQLKDELYRVFVTMTTDALEANPVDGKSALVGGQRLLDQLWDVPYQAYETPNQCSTWIFNNAKNGKYTLRNNNCNYVTYSDYIEIDNENLTLSRDIEKDGYEIALKLDVDFADNGRFSIKQDEKYLTTKADGSLSLTTEFGPASSWKLTRAFDKKFDKPRLSTKKDPIYYVIRNANHPDKYLYATSKFMNLGELNETAQWYFVDTERENGSYYAYTKSGHFMGSTQAGHLYTYTSSSSKPSPLYTYFRDGSESYGACILTRSETVYTYSDSNPGHMAYDDSDGYVDMNMIKNTYHDWTVNPGVFSWFFESINEADLSTLLVAQKEVNDLLKSYLASQPWAVDYLTNAIAKIQAVNLNDYASGEEAAEAVRAMGEAYVSELPGVINSEVASYFKSGARVALYNVRRGASQTADGKPLGSVTSGTSTVFNTVVGLPDSISTWEFEASTKAGFFKIKTLKGAYLGAIKSGQPIEGVAKSAAADYAISLVNGYVTLTNNTGRSAINIDATNGNLTANSPSDAGSSWVIARVNVVESRADAPKISTGDEMYYYVIHNVGDPTKYIRTSEANWYMTWSVEEDRSYFYFTSTEDGNGVYINSMIYTGNRLMINVDKNGKLDAPAPIWYAANTTRTDAQARWYIIPNEYGNKEGFQISMTYPASENSCVSMVSPGGSFNEISCGMGNAEDYLNTAFVFEYRAGLDHEHLFDVKRIPLLETTRSYLTSQPWMHDMIAPAVDRLENCVMTDFGADSYVASNAMTAYVNRVMNEVEAEMDYAPEDWVVAISNVRRAGEDGKAYLASVNGKANTSAVLDASAIWTLEYYSNGRYNLRNDNGEYLGALGKEVVVTTDPNQAGHYQVMLANGYVTLVDRSNPADAALNVNSGTGNACSASQSDRGSWWTVEMVRESSLSDIAASAAAEVEYYDLRGIRVNGSAFTPGVYLQRMGTKVHKIIVK